MGLQGILQLPYPVVVPVRQSLKVLKGVRRRGLHPVLVTRRSAFENLRMMMSSNNSFVLDIATIILQPLQRIQSDQCSVIVEWGV